MDKAKNKRKADEFDKQELEDFLTFLGSEEVPVNEENNPSIMKKIMFQKPENGIVKE